MGGGGSAWDESRYGANMTLFALDTWWECQPLNTLFHLNIFKGDTLFNGWDWAH